MCKKKIHEKVRKGKDRRKGNVMREGGREDGEEDRETLHLQSVMR